MSVDPITVEIIRCALKAAANEMSAVLKKTAYNMMIYEVQDYCVAVLDHEGRTMSQNEGALPIFLADLGVAVQDGIEVYGKDNIHPGDVFLVNHPEICGQHLNNMAVYTPFFWEGELLCFLAVRAHWIDVGGGSTGFGSSNTRDVYEEGLQVRSVKIYKRGEPNTEVLRLIEDNIRFPESSLGDLRAQIACCRTGEERLEQICRKYGGARFQEAVAGDLGADRQARARIGARDPRRRLRSLVVSRRRRPGDEQDDSAQDQGRGARRRADHRLFRSQRSSAGLHQLRRVRRHGRGAGRVQSVDLAAARSERRLVSRAQSDFAAGKTAERAPAGADRRLESVACRRCSTRSFARWRPRCRSACRRRTRATWAATRSSA